jgi:hypothetical protein
MPQMMGNAFLGAVLEYLDVPSQLNVILCGLDQVRKAAYSLSTDSVSCRQ